MLMVICMLVLFHIYPMLMVMHMLVLFHTYPMLMVIYMLVLFHIDSMLMVIYMFRLPEGRRGQVWERSKKKSFCGNRGGFS